MQFGIVSRSSGALKIASDCYYKMGYTAHALYATAGHAIHCNTSLQHVHTSIRDKLRVALFTCLCIYVVQAVPGR